MLNIFKIWFFTAVFLLSRRKYFKQFEKYDEVKKEKEIFELLREFDNYILNKLKIEVEIINKENIKLDETVLYVSNHPSMLDPLFLLKAINYPVSFFVAIESKIVLKVPYGKNFYKYMKNIYIDRKSIKSGVKSISEGKQRLRTGFNLAIFPEGQITKVLTDDLVGTFKGGSFKTVLDEKKSIIPISIVGADGIQKKPSIFSPINSKNVSLIVHKEVTFDVIKNLKTNEIAQYTQNIILKGLQGSK